MKLRTAIMTMALVAVAQMAMAQATYQGQISAVFNDKCAGCHGKDAAPEYQVFKQQKDAYVAKGQGMRMDSYTLLSSYVVWPNTGALMRRLDDGANTKDKKPGNMYEYLGSTAAERAQNLALFKEWVGGWSLKRFKDMSKQELDAMKVPY
jgi:cytochrome c1